MHKNRPGLKTAASSSYGKASRGSGSAASGSLGLAPFALALSFSFSLSLPAIAVPFQFDVGVSGRTKGTIELLHADDEKILQRVALTKSKSYSLDFPSEGLYLVRIKNKDKIVWKESVYVMTEMPKPDVLVRSSWQLSPAAMRTVLRVQDPAGDLRYGVSIRDKIFLRLRAVPRLVRVFQEDYSGNTTAAVDVKIGKVSEKEARVEAAEVLPEIQLDASGPEDDQAAYEPDYKGLLAGKEDKSWKQKVLDLSASRRLEPLNRPHRVYAWLRIMQESFRVRRAPDSYNGEKTQGFGTGIGGNLVFKDTMSLQLEVDTHGTQTQYEKGGSNPPAEEQRRVHARISPMFDILNVEHNHPRFAFELGPVVGYTQVPLEQDNQGKTDFGLSMRWQYFGVNHTEAQFRFMKSHSRDLSLLWIGTAYKVATLSPLFGVYNYHSEFDGADSRAEFDEAGVRFGIHSEF